MHSINKEKKNINKIWLVRIVWDKGAMSCTNRLRN
uniref:Uncharacterized protein n=1 Tax=Arundo donax TaxID=35708 RepID=A0A0A9CBS4_ARUDO